MSRTRPALSAVLLATVTALSACSGSGGDAGAAAGVTSVPAPSSSSTPASSSTSAPAPADTPGDGATTGGVDGAAQFEAVKTASGAVAAYTDADADPAAWHENVSGYATPELAASLRGTGPARVPVAMTGTPEVALVESPTSVRVRVPTDAGDFSLGLSRADATTTAWKVFEIVAPE